MGEWRKVRWTQAGQVVSALGDDAARQPPVGALPSAWFETLRGDGELAAAAGFLGAALPRYESVSWAAAAVGAMRRDGLAPGDAHAASMVGAWVANPDDEQRRAAHDASTKAGDASPERLLGLAVYMSGGSIAPADLDAVNPEPDICGRMTAAAVITAAYRTADPQAALVQALDAGDLVARGK